MADEVDVIGDGISDRGGHVINDMGGHVINDVMDAITNPVTPGTVLVVIGVITLLVTVVVGRRVLIRRALSHDKRTQLTVIPAESFDPTGEEVARYAAQLARMRRSFVTRPAQAVRLRLDAVGEGQVAYRLEGPSSARSILETAGYYDVELHPGSGGDLVNRDVEGPATESVGADDIAGAAVAVHAEVGEDDPQREGESYADVSHHGARLSHQDRHGDAQPHRRDWVGDVEGARW